MPRTRRPERLPFDFFSKPSLPPRSLNTTHTKDPAHALQTLMGFADDTDKFSKYKETMARCCGRHLRTSKTWSKQAPEAAAKYLRSVSKRIRLMDEYEDRWPAVAFAKFWLVRIRSTISKRRQSVESPAPSGKRGPRASPTVNVKQEQLHERQGLGGDIQNIGPQTRPRTRASCAGPQDAAREPPLASNTQPSARFATQSTVPAATQTTSSCSTHSHARRPTTKATTSSTQGAPPAKSASVSPVLPAGTQPVLAFLRSLAQPLEHLLPTLFDVGVRDAASLRGLAVMRDSSSLLYPLVIRGKLTHLEYWLILEGLNVLAEPKQ